jgi:hypothetical protein
MSMTHKLRRVGSTCHCHHRRTARRRIPHHERSDPGPNLAYKHRYCNSSCAHNNAYSLCPGNFPANTPCLQLWLCVSNCTSRNRNSSSFLAPRNK